MFRTVPLSHHQEFFTVHTAMVYVIQLASRIRTDVFRIFPLSIIRSFSLYKQQWYMWYSLRAGLGRICFGHFLWPSSGVFSLYTQQWYMSYRFADSLRAGSVSSWSCSQAVSKHVCIAVCTVKNSWWWTEELSETCRVLFQKINSRN